MREDACQCSPCHDCHELPRIVHEQFTSSSRVLHYMFTSNSRTVHEQFMTTARQWRSRWCVGIYVVFLDTARLYRDRQRRDKLYHRDNMTLKTKQTKWHDLPRQNRGQRSCECQPCISIQIYALMSATVPQLFTTLTLSQTTHFRLFQTERGCRRQF